MRKEVTLHRSDLYEQVWETPMIRLASQYGISDKGLAKICKKLNVPVPPRGYWATIKSGIKLNKPKLPRIKEGSPETHTLSTYTHGVRFSNKLEGVSDAAAELITLILEGAPIKVMSRLSSPHPLVEKTQKNMEKKKPKDHPLISPSRQGLLNISVSPQSLSRTLRIMDSLLKTFQVYGFKIGKDQEKHSGVYVHVLGEKISFSTDEKLRRIDHVPTKKEKEEQKKYSWMTWPQYDFVPSGSLNLKINESYWASGLQKKWTDGKLKSLEDKLPSFIIGMIKVADRIGKERIERAERERRWQEEREREETERKRQLAEEKRLQDLERQAILWTKSQQLYQYIHAVKDRANKKSYNEDTQAMVEEWIEWAIKHAENLDPINLLLPDDDKSIS